MEAVAPRQLAALATQLIPSEQAEIKVTPLTAVEEMLALARQMAGA